MGYFNLSLVTTTEKKIKIKRILLFSCGGYKLFLFVCLMRQFQYFSIDGIKRIKVTFLQTWGGTLFTKHSLYLKGNKGETADCKLLQIGTSVSRAQTTTLASGFFGVADIVRLIYLIGPRAGYTSKFGNASSNFHIFMRGKEMM